MQLPRGEEQGALQLSRRQVVVGLALAAATALLLALVFSARFSFFSTPSPADVTFVANQPSPVRVVAPDRITFVSDLNTQRAQDEAAARVADI
ncbi:MAG: hypothetical protein ACM3JD_03375, partial [Rudaea sp.]